MKKLFKLATLAALVGGITWVLRDQLLPGPQQPTAHPPPFRNPPPPADDPGTANGTERADEGFALQDDLTAVNGIGPVYANRLNAAGIKSFADLAKATAEDLANRTDLPRDRVDDWIRKASDLA
ncbi:MAG: helix-hairpin-helix domain-containing protein [Acidimicrobiia bacterium]|nr:helix-hairpin-helix domain-containing protein [Acidimicrobiia bacterium]